MTSIDVITNVLKSLLPKVSLRIIEPPRMVGASETSGISCDSKRGSNNVVFRTG